MRVANTTSPMRVTNTTSPMRVTDTTSPMRVTDIDLPIVVEPIEAKTIIDSPIVAQLIEEQSITDIHDDAENENLICLINYGAEFQGLVITDQEIECHYYDVHTSLLNTFINDSYAILILEGYMIALVKQRDNFYLFDSHARDSCGMPDPNGTAVVMKFTNILELEQYWYSLSIELHANIFEIVPVQLNMCKLSKYVQNTKYVHDMDREYQKKRRSVETESVKKARLSKVNDHEYNKRKQSEETGSEKLVRLQKAVEYKKKKTVRRN